MELTELYKQYREEQLAFIDQKIMKYINEEYVANAAAALNMLDKNGKMVFEEEYSFSHILEFAIYEFRLEGKNLIERYAEERGAENEAEERVIKAMLDSYTSLFRVVNISTEKNMLFLKDAFNQRKNIRLIDLSLSQNLDTEALLFTRVLPFPELNMTSGLPFAFPGELEVRMISDYKRAVGTVIEDNSATKYLWFYNLNRLQNEAAHEHHHHHHHEHKHDHTHKHEHHHHGHDCGCGHEH